VTPGRPAATRTNRLLIGAVGALCTALTLGVLSGPAAEAAPVTTSGINVVGAAAQFAQRRRPVEPVHAADQDAPAEGDGTPRQAAHGSEHAHPIPLPSDQDASGRTLGRDGRLLAWTAA
jgi:hypothetical protein